MFLPFVAALCASLLTMTKADKLAGVNCDGTEEYVVPDPTYCDRYLSCPEEEVELCQTGMVLDLNTGYCHKEELTNCNGREMIFRKKQRTQQTIKPLRRLARVTTTRTPTATTTTRELTTAVSKSRLSLFGSRRRPNYLSSSRHLNIAKTVLDTATTEETTTTTLSPTNTSRLLVVKKTPPPADIDPFESVVCEDGDEYLLPDPTYCDRYLSCPEGKVEVCQGGLVMNLNTGFCSKEENTDCRNRELLFRDVEIEVEIRLVEKVNRIKKENEDIMASPNTIIKKPSEVKYPRNLLLRQKNNPAKKLNPSSSSKIYSSSSFSDDRQTPTNSNKSPKNLLLRKRTNPTKTLSPNFSSKSYSSSSISTNSKTPPKLSSSSVSNKKQSPTPLKSSSSDPLADVECEQSDEGYIVPDSEQCDRFAHCSTEGEKFYKLCPDGLVLSLTTGVCDYQGNVDCEDRTRLQSSTPKVECPRENGNFPLPASESCSKYIDCQDGEGQIKRCEVPNVFHESLGCVHPDEADRPGCSAAEIGFQCPELGSRPRFGDHDRVPHPTDCKQFYVCYKTGKPRLLSCDKPSVFNPEKAICDDQELVPGCEDYYVKEVATVSKEEYSRISQEIREQLIKEFGLNTL